MQHAIDALASLATEMLETPEGLHFIAADLDGQLAKVAGLGVVIHLNGLAMFVRGSSSSR
jgi:hypothetical protein